MECEICGKGPMEGVSIHRTGKKGPGQDPHWRCESDMPKAKVVDQEVAELVAIIENNEVVIKH